MEPGAPACQGLLLCCHLLAEVIPNKHKGSFPYIPFGTVVSMTSFLWPTLAVCPFHPTLSKNPIRQDLPWLLISDQTCEISISKPLGDVP